MNFMESAASSMNYLFLKVTERKLESEYVKEELQMFFTRLSHDILEKGDNRNREEERLLNVYTELVLDELVEGTYYDFHNPEEFEELLKKSLLDVLGEVDERILVFYLSLFKKAIEEEEALAE